MAIPIITPNIQPQVLPTDIMARIAASRQAQASAQAAQMQNQLEQQLDPLKVQTAQFNVQQLPKIAQQRAKAAQLNQLLTLAKVRESQATAGKAGRTDVTNLNEALQNLRTNVAQFGKNDPRTLAAAALVAKLSGLQNVPTSQPGTVTVSPANTAGVNATIQQANSQTAVTPPAQATAEINAAIPQSNVATEQEKAAVKPDIDQQKDLNKEATSVLASVVNRAQDDPFLKAQATQLSSEWNNINADAAQAREHEIPLYKTLLNDINQTNLVGPITGHINWASPAGQKLRADLTRAQGEFIKTFHLGRMTQIEFNFLKNAVGTANMYPSALRKIFADVLGKDNQSIAKANFYHNYITKGGRRSDEVDSQWIKAQPNILAEANKNAQNEVLQTRLGGLPGVTAEQVEALAKKNNMTVDHVLDILKSRMGETKNG